MTIWVHLGVILASDSVKKQKRDAPEKHVVLGEGQYACPGAITTSEGSRDVRTRRANGALFKGNQEAEAQKANHLGQDFEPKTGELLIWTKTTSQPIF